MLQHLNISYSLFLQSYRYCIASIGCINHIQAVKRAIQVYMCVLNDVPGLTNSPQCTPCTLRIYTFTHTYKQNNSIAFEIAFSGRGKYKKGSMCKIHMEPALRAQVQ